MFKSTHGGFISARKTGATEDYQEHPLRVLRRKLKLSRAKMAHLLGVQANTIYQWEIGRRHPQRSSMYMIAMLVDGFTVPDRIRKKFMPKTKSLRQWRRAPKYAMSLDAEKHKAIMERRDHFSDLT